MAGRAKALPATLLLLALTTACLGPAGPGNEGPGGPVRGGSETYGVTAVWLAEDTPPPARGTLIRRLDLRSGSVDTVLDLTRGDSAGPLQSTRPTLIQVIRDAEPQIGQGLFQADPRLAVHDHTGRKLYDVGRAGQADLTPDGGSLLWWVPSEIRTCADDHDAEHEDEEEHEEEPCRLPDATIVVADPQDPSSAREVARAEQVANAAWFTSDSAIVFREDGGHTVVTFEGSESPLPFDDRYLDHVPASGRFLTVSHDLHSLRLRERDGTVVWERDYGEWRVDAVPSRDGRWVLVYAVKAHPDHSASTRVEVVDAAGRVREMDETDADGELHWTSDSEVFAYRRLASDNGFELVLCRITDLECSPAFSWTEGMTVLGLEGRK